MSSAARQSVAVIVPIRVWPKAIGVAGQVAMKSSTSRSPPLAVNTRVGGVKTNPVRLGVAR